MSIHKKLQVQVVFNFLHCLNNLTVGQPTTLYDIFPTYNLITSIILSNTFESTKGTEVEERDRSIDDMVRDESGERTFIV